MSTKSYLFVCLSNLFNKIDDCTVRMDTSVLGLCNGRKD